MSLRLSINYATTSELLEHVQNLTPAEVLARELPSMVASLEEAWAEAGETGPSLYVLQLTREARP